MENAEKDHSEEKCEGKTEVYSRVSGFYRPVTQWNKGKKEEFRERLVYSCDNACCRLDSPDEDDDRDHPEADTAAETD